MTQTTQTKEQVIKQIIEVINDMDTNELIQLNDEYCESINSIDSRIYNNDEDFLQVCFDGNLDGLARAICFGDYRYNDNYVRFDGYGNLESFNYFESKDLPDYLPTMAEYIFDTFQDFSQFDEIDFHNIED
jgi:hypothetical protein